MPSYTSLPLSNVSENVKGEQIYVLQVRGLPDAVLEGPLGTTRWVFCASLPEGLIIELDCNSFVLSRWLSANTRYCSDNSEISEAENCREE